MLSEQDKTFLGKVFLDYNFTMTTAQLNKEKLYYRAIQSYVKDPHKNIPNLMEYAKALRVQKKVNDLIGVWL